MTIPFSAKPYRQDAMTYGYHLKDGWGHVIYQAGGFRTLDEAARAGDAEVDRRNAHLARP